jgi:LytS/YehU family sensor histidine kinase
MDKSKNDKIIRQKENLAAKALQVAEDALEILQGGLEECSARDLVQVFNSAVKAHREIVSDIISLSEAEDKPSEQELAKEYKGAASSLIEKFKL